MATGALGIVGSGVFGGATNEGLQLGETSLKKAGTSDAVLTVQVKNVGTSEVDSVTVTLNGITLGIASPTSTVLNFTANCDTGCDITFANTPNMDSSETNYFTSTIPDSDDLDIGDSYTITVTGTIDGSQVVTTGVVTVTRF